MSIASRSWILAVEPDGAKADLLRAVVAGHVDAELTVVTSAYAAVVSINQRTPALLVLGSTLDSKARQKVTAHLCSVAGLPQAPALILPPLGGHEASGPGLRFRFRRTSPDKPTASYLAALGRRVASSLAQALDERRAATAALATTRPARAGAESARATRFADGAAEPAAPAIGRSTAGPIETGTAPPADASPPARKPPAHFAGLGPGTVPTPEACAAGEPKTLAPEPHDDDVSDDSDGEEVVIDIDGPWDETAPIDPEVRSADLAVLRPQEEAALETKIERVREEADVERRRHEETRRDEDTSREAAARQARTAEEAAAARALEEEVARVRAEAHDHLTAEISQVREEAEQARQAQEQTLAEAEAEATRKSAECEARAAASEAAAIALGQEVARARADAEAHFRTELERLRSDASRSAGDAPVNALETQARAHADAALHEQLERIRAEANARFADELAQAKTEAEHRRHAEVEDMRSQLAQVHKAASQQARAAAAGMVSAEISRAATRIADAVTPARNAAAARAVSSAARAAVMRLSGAVAVLLLAGGVATAGPALLQETVHVVRSTSDLTASWFRASVWARTPRASDAPTSADAILQVDTPSGDVDEPGMLSVTSRIPLDLYLSGRRVGTTGDRRLTLPAGRHTLELVSERYSYRGQLAVTVEPSRLSSRTVPLPDGRVRITTADGAEIWIDDTYQGVAPLGTLAVPIGTQGLLVRHPQLGERRLGIEVRYGTVTEATVTFRPGGMGSNAFPLPPLSRNAASGR